MIRIALLGFAVVMFLGACDQRERIQQPPVIEVRTLEVERPKPIVPPVDQLRLREIEWHILTPENIDEHFANIRGDRVVFALTPEGYEALSLNLSDIRAMIQQQQRVIAIYRDH
ncbi:MAG: hypothetical protein WCY93_08595 [Anaerolineaceae bacterium]